MHYAALSRVVISRSLMQTRPVIYQHQVAWLPLMSINLCRIDRFRQQAVNEVIAFRYRHPLNRHHLQRVNVQSATTSLSMGSNTRVS